MTPNKRFFPLEVSSRELVADSHLGVEARAYYPPVPRRRLMPRNEISIPTAKIAIRFMMMLNEWKQKQPLEPVANCEKLDTRPNTNNIPKLLLGSISGDCGNLEHRLGFFPKPIVLELF